MNSKISMTPEPPSSFSWVASRTLNLSRCSALLGRVKHIPWSILSNTGSVVCIPNVPISLCQRCQRFVISGQTRNRSNERIVLLRLITNGKPYCDILAESSSPHLETLVAISCLQRKCHPSISKILQPHQQCSRSKGLKSLYSLVLAQYSLLSIAHTHTGGESNQCVTMHFISRARAPIRSQLSHEWELQ